MESINAAYIHNLRLRLGLSQDEFAAQLGTTGRSISRWETGERVPRSKAMIRKMRELAKSIRGDPPVSKDILELVMKENRELKSRLAKLEKKEKLKRTETGAS